VPETQQPCGFAPRAGRISRWVSLNQPSQRTRGFRPPIDADRAGGG
jgi:hypothetical protein